MLRTVLSENQATSKVQPYTGNQKKSKGLLLWKETREVGCEHTQRHSVEGQVLRAIGSDCTLWILSPCFEWGVQRDKRLLAQAVPLSPGFQTGHHTHPAGAQSLGTSG